MVVLALIVLMVIGMLGQTTFGVASLTGSTEVPPKTTQEEVVFAKAVWVWVKIKPPGDRRFWSMFPFTMIPFWVHIFDPQPYEHL